MDAELTPSMPPPRDPVQAYAEKLGARLDAAADPHVRLTTGQQKITGYRELEPSEIALINAIKRHAEQTGVLVETLARNTDGLDIDARWVAIAKTDLQTGFMALVRAVAQPTSF